jgi:hypothetical protein
MAREVSYHEGKALHVPNDMPAQPAPVPEQIATICF